MPGDVATTKPKVAFSAYRSSDLSGLSSGYIIKFDTVLTNRGGHYYPQDGIFTAPVTGLYQFHWQFLSYGKNVAACSKLMVNGTEKGWTYDWVQSGYTDSAANMVIVDVKEKQHVWVETNSEAVTLYQKSSFSGMLIV